MKFNYPKAVITDSEAAIALKEEELIPLNGLDVVERCEGPLAAKAFFLPDIFDWLIVKDDQGVLCLVPLKHTKKEVHINV